MWQNIMKSTKCKCVGGNPTVLFIIYGQAGQMYRRTGLSVSLVAIALCALFFVSQVQATPTPEHVDGVPSGASDIGLSGDGEWISWVDYTPPELTVHNLTSGVQTTLNLITTTGDVDLDFGNDAYPDLSTDGSVIAVMADGPSGSRGPEIPLVLSSSGIEIARVNGSYFGDVATFEYDIFIDGSGRYVIFVTDANYLQSVLSGGATSTLTPTGNLDNVYRLDIQTGVMELVPIRAGGAELNDYAYPLGISDGGRYVLFETRSTSLAGANGDNHVYIRDMSSESITRVSVDDAGALLSGLACCRTVPEISADGSRVIFTENNGTSSDGQNHTFMWTRGVGSRELIEVEQESGITISGDGLWLTAESNDFSRLDIDNGISDPLPEVNAGIPEDVSDPIISRDGQLVVFWNSSITRPVGEDGRWWLLRFEDESDMIYSNGFE